MSDDSPKAQRHAPKGKIKRDPVRNADSKGNPKHAHTQRCTALSKQRGAQCLQPVVPGAVVCHYHGGKAPQVLASAQERLRALQHPAIDTMDYLMSQRETFPSTAYQAARDVLDRTEGKAIETVRQEHSGGLVIRHERVD